MTAPVRLQLSRRKGFDLQLLSLATNGLLAVKVDRATKWGNPFVSTWSGLGAGRMPMNPVVAVGSFRSLLTKEGAWWPHPMPWPKGKIPAGPQTTLDDVRCELGGKNLACWCKPGEPCHGDVLLEIANPSQ